MPLELHQKIKATREIHHFTVDYMSSHLAIAESQYLQLENGNLEISVDLLLQISRLLHVSINYFLLNQHTSTSVNNFNNRSLNNQGNLVYNTNYISTVVSLYQKLISQKEEEIVYLKNILEKEI